MFRVGALGQYFSAGDDTLATSTGCSADLKALHRRSPVWTLLVDGASVRTHWHSCISMSNAMCFCLSQPPNPMLKLELHQRATYDVPSSISPYIPIPLIAITSPSDQDASLVPEKKDPWPSLHLEPPATHHPNPRRTAPLFSNPHGREGPCSHQSTSGSTLHHSAHQASPAT